MLKTLFSKLISYRFVLGGLLLVSLLALYAYQHSAGEQIFDFQNSTERGLLLYTPLVLGLLVLLTPFFVINPRRRALSIAALVIAVPVSGMSLWVGNGLTTLDGFEWLGIILANYMFFPVAYAVVILYGWIAIKLADMAESKGHSWWLNFFFAYFLPLVSWAVIAGRKPAR